MRNKKVRELKKFAVRVWSGLSNDEKKRYQKSVFFKPTRQRVAGAWVYQKEVLKDSKGKVVLDKNDKPRKRTSGVFYQIPAFRTFFRSLKKKYTRAAAEGRV